MVHAYHGPATLETFTIVFGRSGEPDFGTVIGRTPANERLMARVPASDAGSLGFLMDLDRIPVGSRGEVTAGADGLLQWRVVQ
jgi:acetyl-CoA C-acetyltransferase